MKRVLSVIALVAFGLAITNFGWFFAKSAELGGDALNGYRAGDECFVSNHGRETKVDCWVWERNRLQAISLFVTHPLGMIGGTYLLFAVVFPWGMGHRPSAATAARRKQLVASGPLVLERRTGGRISWLRMSYGLLKVRVYPAGLSLTPLFGAEVVVLASEVTELRLERALLARYLRLEHRSPEVGSPIRFYESAESELGRAIERMTGRSFAAARRVA